MILKPKFSFSAQKWPSNVQINIVNIQYEFMEVIGSRISMPINVTIVCTLSWESTQDWHKCSTDFRCLFCWSMDALSVLDRTPNFEARSVWNVFTTDLFVALSLSPLAISS
jgi:hypothetical protein